MTARAVRSRPAATEKYQARTLDAHCRHCLQGDDKTLWDDAKAEYWRKAKTPSTIGFLSALLALSYRDLCELESL